MESLVRIGLTFQAAYLLAQEVRDGLEDQTEVTKDTLKKRVVAALKKDFSEELALSYELGSSQDRQIMVRGTDDEIPFSVGILSRSLQACAIDRTDAMETAKQVYEQLRIGESDVVTHSALRQIVYDCLQAQGSQSAAERFFAWQRFRDSDLPLIVLVGGITGTGKSTVTTELAYQLSIVRTQSTDMMREIIRCYLPSKPTLSYSSFEAWRGLKANVEAETDVGQAEVVDGFVSQFELVRSGLQATISRAIKETHDLIIDGVHVLPSRLELDINQDNAIVVPLVLVVPNKKTLAKRLKRRAREQPDRASSRYLKRLDEIWLLQTFLVAEAEEHGVPLIVNSDIDEAMHEILMEISKTIMQRFPAPL